jgi:hypothetical protein
MFNFGDFLSISNFVWRAFVEKKNRFFQFSFSANNLIILFREPINPKNKPSTFPIAIDF